MMVAETKFCQGCGAAWELGTRFCGACGTGIDGPAGVTPEQGRAALQARVNSYVGQQYRVVSQTETTAQLVKPKRFSAVWFLVWLVLALLPAVVYIGYHVFLKRESQVYLVVDEMGRVHETRDKR